MRDHPPEETHPLRAGHTRPTARCEALFGAVGHRVVRLSAGPDGRAVVQLEGGAAVVRVYPHEAGPTLREVELVIPSDVRTLDLSSLPAGIQVCLRHAGGLSHLILPPTPAQTASTHPRGAELRLDLSGCPGLRIDGATSMLWARWSDAGNPAGSGGPLLKQLPGMAPWRSVWLGDEPPGALVEAVVLHGRSGGRHLDLSDLPRCRTVVVHRCAARSVTLGSAEQIRVQGCPDLKRLTVGEVHCAEVMLCAQLEEIRGCGHSLSLAGCHRVEALRVVGVWSRLTVQFCGWRVLHVGAVEAVHLGRRCAVDSVWGAPGHLLLLYDEECPHAPNAGRVELRNSDVRRVGLRRTEAQSLDAGVRKRLDAGDGRLGISAVQLMATHDALMRGDLRASSAWALLSAIARTQRARLAGAHHREWFGPFCTRRLGDAGTAGEPLDPRWWAAVSIWWACRERVAAARDLDDVVQRYLHPMAMEALASKLPDTPGVAPHLLAGMRAPLAAGSVRPDLGAPSDSTCGLETVFGRILGHIVNAHPAVDRAELASALVTHLQARIRARQPLVSVLAAIHQLGDPHAAQALSELVTDPGVPGSCRRAALVGLIAAPHPEARPLLSAEWSSTRRRPWMPRAIGSDGQCRLF